VSAAALIPVIAPELVGNPNISAAITLATSQVATGHCYRDAVIAHMAAHILTLAGRGGAGGAVTSEAEGSLSRAFATNKADGLAATAYGQEVERLNRLCYGISARTAWNG
jgi:hypothetical protein